jgi:hypothetical protein
LAAYLSGEVLLSCRPHHSADAFATGSHRGEVVYPSRFLRYGSDPPPSAPDFATVIGVLPLGTGSTQIRGCFEPNQCQARLLAHPGTPVDRQPRIGS